MKSNRSTSKCSSEPKPRRQRTIVVVTAFMLLPVFAFSALAMDLAYLRAMKKNLQNTADSAALPGVSQLASYGNVVTVAQQYAGKNMPSDTHGNVLAPADVFVGRWNSLTRTFTANQAPWNAVRVITRRAAANGNPAPLWFANIFGQSVSDVAAEAVAVSSGSAGIAGRFMLDEDMWDTDVPAIQDLAADLGVPPEDLLTDNDGDWFIDIPGGRILELPTGQVGDEGIFDTDHPAFPFAPHGSLIHGFSPYG